MTDSIKKLINLGAETLAEALYDYAQVSREGKDLVERLFVTPAEKARLVPRHQET